MNDNWGADPRRKPSIGEDEQELFSECGRSLNNTDYRSHWFVMTENHGQVQILVKHGAGEERFHLGFKSMLKQFVDAAASMDSDTRYLTFHTLFRVHSEARYSAITDTSRKYAQAFVDGRLKKRKRNNQVRVEIVAA